MTEEIIYQAGSIIISKTSARFGGITYPTNGIGSVYISEPDKTGGYILAMIFALAALVTVIVGVLSGGSGTAAIISLLIGIILGVVSYVIYRMTNQRPYSLVLRTASGDQHAYATQDTKSLAVVKEAIERAVSLRG